MAEIARACGFSVREPVVGNQISRDVVTAVLSGMAGELHEGDTLLLTYAGHGCREVATPGTGGGAYRESWCLPDGQLWDHELYALWPAFRSGVRIIVVSESCYSQTIGSQRLHDAEVIAFRERRLGDLARTWQLPEDCTRWAIPDRPNDASIGASILVLGACKEEETAVDGLFTKKLWQTWTTGGAGDYCQFMRRIKNAMYPDPQTPAMSFVGRPNPGFLQEQPFTI
ncbi:MAG: caspase family protein [Gemmatimonadetes bacterium]|nr:caspase family protein [Gemmatimonadota bacterium]